MENEEEIPLEPGEATDGQTYLEKAKFHNWELHRRLILCDEFIQQVRKEAKEYFSNREIDLNQRWHDYTKMPDVYQINISESSLHRYLPVLAQLDYNYDLNHETSPGNRREMSSFIENDIMEAFRYEEEEGGGDLHDDGFTWELIDELREQVLSHNIGGFWEQD